MARVNRTTGFFLILGVAALLGTVAGARWLIPADTLPHGHEAPPVVENSIFTAGNFDVASGVAVLVPTVPGKVTAVYVKEGDVVRAGQVLVQLDDKAQRDQLAIAEQALQVSKAKLADARRAAQELVKAHEARGDLLAHAVEAARTEYDLRSREYTKAHEIYEKKLVGDADHKLMLAKSAAELAYKNIGAAERQLAKHKEIDPVPSMREAEEALKEADLRVQAAKEALDAYQIKAPMDGQVFEVNYQVGGSAPLPMGDPNISRALVFCPNEALVVRAEINQEWALMVQPGMKAIITFQGADRDYRWTGSVEKVAGYIQRRRSRVMEPDSFNDTRTRECLIRIDPDGTNPIVLGLRVNVQILTGTSR